MQEWLWALPVEAAPKMAGNCFPSGLEQIKRFWELGQKAKEGRNPYHISILNLCLQDPMEAKVVRVLFLNIHRQTNG